MKADDSKLKGAQTKLSKLQEKFDTQKKQLHQSNAEIKELKKLLDNEKNKYKNAIPVENNGVISKPATRTRQSKKRSKAKKVLDNECEDEEEEEAEVALNGTTTTAATATTTTTTSALDMADTGSSTIIDETEVPCKLYNILRYFQNYF